MYIALLFVSCLARRRKKRKSIKMNIAVWQTSSSPFAHFKMLLLGSLLSSITIFSHNRQRRRRWSKFFRLWRFVRCTNLFSQYCSVPCCVWKRWKQCKVSSNGSSWVTAGLGISRSTRHNTGCLCGTLNCARSAESRLNGTCISRIWDTIFAMAMPGRWKCI